ncbi:MAG: DUF1553 domain-containing protein [Planctomycetes bacterium]|nr:DUF1553 domain-containing protein [Planctomycetota bacterium]
MSLLPLRFPCLTLLAAGLIHVGSLSAADPGSAKVEYNRDIRTILSDKCFVCHGPDSGKRKAGLRLDQAESATADRDDAPAIVPGSAVKSEAYRRITSTDPELQMPPANSNLRLTAAEIELLKQWIDQGAEYQRHWAFLPPLSKTPPETQQSATLRSPIDAFVRARLDREGLTAASEADKSTLIRRVSFDLLGLPPSPDEVAEFAADASPDAFERLIDRLLASPRFGERMASNWLDAARFADTNGYQTDGPRFMWRWRDWVIDAFNQNEPFDQFTIDQLAGDLLEKPPVSGQSSAIANSRLIATGFNRNHRGNAEGGIIPEEFRVEYVVDRVETTAAVWLGLTVGCARCHDHKYDPISQREFYQLFAFFNQVPEPGKYIRNDNSMPYLPAPTADQQLKLTALEMNRTAAERAWQAMEPAILEGMKGLAAKIQAAGKHVDWSVPRNLDSHFSLDEGEHYTLLPSSKPAAPAGPATASFVWKDGSAAFAPGRIGNAAEFDGRRSIEAAEAGDFGDDESFAISCWVKPASRTATTILARMDHDNASRGYELRREANGRLQALFSGRILDDLIRVESRTELPLNQWSHIYVSYDGSSAARGVAVRINGEPAELTVITDLLSNPIRVKLPLYIGAGGSAAPFVGLIDEVRCYRGRLTSPEIQSLAAGETISQIVLRPLDQLPVTHLEKLREYYMAEYAPQSLKQTRQQLLDARDQYRAYLATIPTTMVMQDQTQPRETRLLKRGEYDKPGDVVAAGLPAALPELQRTGQKLDRLALAQWLVSPENPLTARVTVNRIWQSLFGVGLVKTAEDFGTQGESPTHPELLDWLAIEFGGTSTNPRGNWDVKRTLRQILTSATYRQSSHANESLLARDPDNRWLTRGPRFRLPAEMIRDAALAASGLLVETIGGPSVKPYQPAGLWEELSAETVPGPFAVYVQDHGPNLYRRGIYTFRKRTVPPPSLSIFDASPREACRVSLPRTNTPLQALNLMNDITYVEAARVLAEQAIKEGGASAPSRLTWAFRRILARDPSEGELKLLVDGLERRRQAYQQHPQDAEQLLKLGETPVDTSLVPAELAAYTATTSVMFNLDEFVAKP